MPQYKGTLRMRIRDVIEAIPDTAGIAVSSKVTVGAGASGIVASMAQWNWPAIVASSVAICGLAINFYFQHRRDKRDRDENRRKEELHQAQLKALQNRCDL
ncbi:MAG: hypothetical protein GX025_10015 [Clostridiales bacterium]|nr:hypothetical protein [Clostridiales bacterium]